MLSLIESLDKKGGKGPADKSSDFRSFLKNK